jgi:hypothetical protein
MSATETPRVDALVPIHSVWNCRLRHNGSGRIAIPSPDGCAPTPAFALLTMVLAVPSDGSAAVAGIAAPSSGSAAAALRAGRLSEGDVPAEDSYRKPVLFLSDLKVSRAKAAELKSKLKEIMDSLKDESGDDPDGVPVNLLIGCYVPADPQPR